MSRLAVPVQSKKGLASKVNEHFAKSDYFAIVQTGPAGPRIAGYVQGSASAKESAGRVADARVDAVLAGRIGSCMISILMGRGILMYSGASGTVRRAVEDYLAGKLAEVRPGPYQL